MDLVSGTKASSILGPAVYDDGTATSTALDATNYGEVVAYAILGTALEAGTVKVTVQQATTLAGAYTDVAGTELDLTEASTGIHVGRLLVPGLGPFFKVSLTVTSTVVEDQMSLPFCGFLMLGQPRFEPATIPTFTAKK